MIAVLLLACALDYVLVVPNRWHPVCWLGYYLTWVKQQQDCYQKPRTLLLMGIVCIALGALGVAAILWCIISLLAYVSVYIAIVFHAVILAFAFSLQGLARAAHAVYHPLAANDLATARQMLGYHMVSRDTSQLESHEIAGAAVESVAENLSDSVIAPLMYFVIGEMLGGWGLVWVWVYRFVNTADAMLGYRKGNLEYLGKGAARFDDVLNIFPARVSALLLCLTAPCVSADRAHAWRVMWRDAGNTSSPNAGWTMATVAGGWDICLDKRGVYVLNAGGGKTRVHHIMQTVQWIRITTGLAIIIFAIVGIQRY